MNPMNPQMFFSVLMQALAVLLQLAAAVWALRLIRITGWRTSWLAISGAFCIMALRRSLFLWQQLANGVEPQSMLVFDGTLAAFISFLMLLGVVTINPLFQAIKRSEAQLRQAGKTLEVEVTARTAELQAAKEQLEAEHRRLYALLDSLPALVYLKAPDYTIRFANRQFRENYGDTEDRRCYEAFGRTAPCGACLSLKVLETGAPIKEEWARPDGKRTYELTHYPFSDIDNSPLVLTLGIDITGHKRMEEVLQHNQDRLEEAQHLARVGSWEWDLACDESLWSQEMFHILGLPPQPQGLNAEGFFACVHPKDREMVRKALADALSGVKPFGLGFRMQRGDGSEFYAHVEAEVHFEDTGHAVKMVGTLQDVTARHQVEEQLRESEAGLRNLTSELLTAQEKERERIARELHDELGQSLLVMKLQMRALQRRALAGDQAPAADHDELLDNLDRLIENVRCISRDLSPYILADLGLEAALHRLLGDFVKHYSIDLQLSGDLNSLNHSFSAPDQIHIYRIFQECLTNIGKHSGAGVLQVDITNGAGEVSFLLTDNGRGFATESVKESPAGAAGIGLSTLEERTRLLGGKLSLSSEPGKGTSVHLVLPVSSGN